MALKSPRRGVQSIRRHYSAALGSFPSRSFYVDATLGNDANPGTHPDEAWQTIGKVNGETFLPGDRILFKRGETWRERLTAPSSGIAGSRIVFGAYGSGALPILSGAVLMAGWVRDTVTETWGENTADDNSGVTEDTHVQGGGASGANFGGATPILTKDYDAASGSSRKIFIRFDLSGGANTVTAATLYLRQTTSLVTAAFLTKCTRAWVEGTATWDDYDGVNPWGANHDQGDLLVNLVIAGGSGYKAINSADLLAYIQSIWGASEVNMSLYTDDPDALDYVSSEGADGRRPYLSITTAAFPNVYSTALVDGSGGPTAVWFDDVLGTKVANLGALALNNDWWWNANVLYIYSDSDPSAKVIEASTLWQCIDQNENSYLRIENIYTEKSRWINLLIDGNATDIELRSVVSHHSYNDGIHIGVAGGGAVTPSNVTLDGCTFSLFNRQNTAQSPGILQHEGTSGGDNLIIRNCTISSDVSVDNSGNTEDGIIVEDGDNVLIEYNNISAVDHGIQMRGSGVGGKDVETFIIRYNLINSFDDAFWLNGTTEADSEIYYNLVTGAGDQIFDIVGEGGEIYNNTCYDGRGNAIALQTLAATKVIFKNNIISHVDNNNTIFWIDDAGGVNIANSTFDNNLYYRTAPVATFGTLTAAGNFTWANWQGVHSQDPNGFNENPDFTTPGTDFTLQAVSPCRDAGVDVGLTRDYANVRVPQETNPAIGAYEYVA